MEEAAEWSTDHYNSYINYKDQVPEDLIFVEKVEAYWMDFGTGCEDLYVVQDLDGNYYGFKAWRALGKHADYNEFYENCYVPDKYDAEDCDPEDLEFDIEDYYVFKPLSIRMAPRYYFPETN